MASTSNLKLASFDGGGPQAFSQLIMMKRLMHQLRWNIYPTDPSRVMLPCEYFDLIGGSDTGGIIAIMFARLSMSVEEVIPAFGRIVEEVYAKGLRREKRTKRLRKCMEDLLTKRGLPVDLKLETNSNEGCLCFVMATSSPNISHKVHFRTYFTRDDPPTDVTVVDAALATCASPSQFLPVTIGAKYNETEYTGAGVGANNPVRQVLAEASAYYRTQGKPTVLLSLGSGHPGILALDRSKDDLGLHKLMHEMMIDCDREDKEIRQQWPDSEEFYFRFSVMQVMQRINHRTKDRRRTAARLITYFKICFRFSVVQGTQKINRRVEEHQWIAAQTNAYFKLPETIPKVSECVNKMSRGTQNNQQIYPLEDSQQMFTLEGPPAYVPKDVTIELPPNDGGNEIVEPIDKPIEHDSVGVIQDAPATVPVEASTLSTPETAMNSATTQLRNSQQTYTLGEALDYIVKEAKIKIPPSRRREELTEEPVVKSIDNESIDSPHPTVPVAPTNTWSEFLRGLLP